jgi:hypothetical protein
MRPTLRVAVVQRISAVVDAPLPSTVGTAGAQDRIEGIEGLAVEPSDGQGPGVVPFWCDVPGLSVCGVAA